MSSKVSVQVLFHLFETVKLQRSSNYNSSLDLPEPCDEDIAFQNLCLVCIVQWNNLITSTSAKGAEPVL